MSRSRRWAQESALLSVAIGALCLVGCGDSSTSPDPPPEAKGRWVGAAPISDAPEPKPDCTQGTSPQLGMDARGGAMATWLSDCSVWAARYVPGQGWLRPEIVGSLPASAPGNWIWEPALAVNASGTALVVWTMQVTAGEGNRQVWARLWPGGTAGWSAAERIEGPEPGPLGEIYGPSIALDPGGNGMVVWGSDRVVAVRLVAGVGWERAERLGSSGYPFAPAVFLDPAGRGFAVWNETETAAAARFDPVHGWDQPIRFGSEDGWSFGGPGRVAFDAVGRAVLVWHRSRGRLLPSAIWSTTYDGGWAPWAQISAAGTVQDPQLGLSSAGVGLAAWSEPTGPAFARRDVQGWGPPASALTAPGIDPQALDLAVNEKADGLLVWSRTGEEPSGVEASRSVGGRWTARETVRAGPTTRHPVGALDACGNAIVIWSEAVGETVRIHANRFDSGGC